MSKFQLLPPLGNEEAHSLLLDIEARGVLVPVMIDERNEIIDGHHRWAIAEKLGIKCPVVKCPPNLSDAEKRTLALGMNLHRRHLSRDQKREAITNSLLADPQLSDRVHAERVGTTHPTVAAVRAELEASGRLESFTSRTSADGRERPSSQPPTVKNTVRDSHSETTEYPAPPSNVDGHTGEIVNFPTPPINDDPEVLALINEHPEVLDMNRDEIGAIAAAIEEFPFLDDYPYEQIVSTADALRAVPEGPERDKRIEAAKTWPAAVAARDTTPKTLTSTDRTRMAIAEVLNITEAIQKSAVIGHAEQAAREIDVDERDEWREVVELALSTCRALLEAITTPTTLRRVK